MSMLAANNGCSGETKTARAGSKKQVTEELLNITELAAHAFFHQKAI